MTITKPSFPTLTPTQLQEGFDKLKGTVEQVRQANGKLSMSKLAKEVNKSDDPTMHAALEVFQDAYTVEKQVRVSSGGCGGSYTTTSDVVKNKLDSAEVKSVLGMLTAAKRRVGKLDANADGKIDIKEAQAANKMGGLSGDLVKAALKQTVGEFITALRSWTNQLFQVHGDISERQDIDKTIKDLTAHHCKHKNGAKAISWALRELATRGKFESWDANAMLNHAEAGKADANPLLAHLERTYGNRRDNRLPKGHLDNKEVRDLLNTDDLDGFVKQMRTLVDERLGMSYLDYLKGNDLDGVEQLNDPDFKDRVAWSLNRTDRVDASC